MSFEPKDISYILVGEDTQIKPIIKKIREQYSNKYSTEDIDILISKIITKKQIEDDF